MEGNPAKSRRRPLLQVVQVPQPGIMHWAAP
jgi:hypothetical protein